MLTRFFERGNVAPRERPWLVVALVTGLGLVLNGVWWPDSAWVVYGLTLVAIGAWSQLVPWFTRTRAGRRWDEE